MLFVSTKSSKCVQYLLVASFLIVFILLVRSLVVTILLLIFCFESAGERASPANRNLFGNALRLRVAPGCDGTVRVLDDPTGEKGGADLLLSARFKFWTVIADVEYNIGLLNKIKDTRDEMRNIERLIECTRLAISEW